MVVPGDDKVVAVTHPTDSFDDFIFFVGDDFDSLEVLMRVVYSESGSLLCCLTGCRDLQFPS